MDCKEDIGEFGAEISKKGKIPADKLIRKEMIRVEEILFRKFSLITRISIIIIKHDQ